MRIVIVGATGGIGKHLVRQALEQGHEVTVLARDPAKLGISHNSLRCVVGDILDPASVEAAMQGNEVVLSALGVPPRQPSADLMKRCIPIIIESMAVHGLRRLVFTSGIVVKTNRLSFAPRLIMRLITRMMLRDQVTDKQAGEALLRNSDVDWTLLYPVILTDGPLTGRYRFGEDIKLHGFPKISRADVADLILKLMADNRSIHGELLISG